MSDRREPVVVRTDGVRGADGWLEQLTEAFGDDGTVATVSPVVLPAAEVDAHGGIEAAAARVRGHGPRRARLERPDPDCMLVARAALDLVGPLDDGFAARASAAGLLHVLAGDVAVAVQGDGGAALARETAATSPEPAERLRRRGRWLARRLAVTIDARILDAAVTGTQIHLLELIAALERTSAVDLRVLAPQRPTPAARDVLRSLDGVHVLDAADVTLDTPPTPVVHRPFQISSEVDLATLRQVGERLVVTHQDLIGYHVGAYHADARTWREYRELTRRSLAVADAVATFSAHAARDLATEELVDERRVRVVPLGADHRLGELAGTPRAPAGAPARLGDTPILLCLGTDLRHKNRVFAIELVRALRDVHGWPGCIVFAGPQAQRGADREAERAAVARLPDEAVVELGAVSEAEKTWLYDRCDAVVYPTTYEGFGLVPFEAAARGRPCLFAPQASLAEVLPREAALLVPWDEKASAARARAVLDDGPERTTQIERVTATARTLRWDATAAALLKVYDDALVARSAAAVDAAWQAFWDDRYWSIDPAGRALVGPDGLFDADAQRTLAGLARRPATRTALVRALQVLRRAARRGDPGG